jgi:hypothetical protein
MHNDAADTLAKEGAKLALPSTTYVGLRAPVVPYQSEQWTEGEHVFGRKVSCDIPELPTKDKQ